MKVNYEEIQYKKYGKCLRISTSKLEAIVTLDLGPRVISFRRTAGENIFWEDLNDELFVNSKTQDQAFYKGATWNAYGGHRVWMAPETYLTYYPDDNKVDYIVEENNFTFIQEPQKHNEIQITLKLNFTDENTVKFIGGIKNLSKAEKKLSVWSLSMCKGPGLEIVKLPEDEREFTPQRLYTLWSFGAKNNDPRAFYGERYFSLRMEPGNPLAYKVGMRLNPGKVMYLTGNEVFVKSFNRDDLKLYPDNNVNYETYTKDVHLELEVLSPLKALKKDEYYHVEEIWNIYKLEEEIPLTNDEDDYEYLYNKYAKKD